MCAALASTRTSLQLRLATAIHSAAARVLQVHLHARLRRTNFVDSGPFSAYDMRLQALSLGLSSWTDGFGITFQAKRETETETLQPLCTSRVFPCAAKKELCRLWQTVAQLLLSPLNQATRMEISWPERKSFWYNVAPSSPKEKPSEKSQLSSRRTRAGRWGWSRHPRRA